MAILVIHERDNVAVTISDIKKGEKVTYGALELTALEDIDKGHKIALRDIEAGENVIKYGFAIGKTNTPVKAGQWLHTHNVKTNLGEVLDYQYSPEPVYHAVSGQCGKSFRGYRRSNGTVGIRNEVWIIPTVSCVNRAAQLIARTAQADLAALPNVDGIYEFTHPYGCSQLGDDHRTTRQILIDLVNHPNAGAVLVLGLGCENNNIPEFKAALGDYDPARVKFLIAQDVEDEIATGLELMEELLQHANQYSRTECPVSELVVGLKCGGSDGFSGITANPLVGSFSDALIGCGGSTVLTEVPEMFGAETILMNRARDEQVFDKTVKLINDFKQYFKFHDQPVYENPSPGNKKGGITTLEDKSLGCTQKGGRSTVVDVLDYGERVSIKGLNLLNGPGNDAVACTVLAASGCHMVLFTTGRGTPLGTAVPTIKVATNSDLFQHKQNWMDFDAGQLLAGKTMEEVTAEFFDYIIAVASGQETKAEKMGFREIAIFKTGVTL